MDTLSLQLNAEQLNEVSAAYRAIAERLPSIIAKGLTDTAYEAKNAVYAKMPTVLDRPTSWTMRSLFVFAAEKKENPIRAAVQFKWEGGFQSRAMLGEIDAPSSMRSQVYGMERPMKSSEKVLRFAGITPADRSFIVPAKGAPRDRYGNVTGAFMNKVLYKGVLGGSASLNPLDGGRSRETTRSGQYFVLRKNGKALGIYQNKGNKNPPMPIFNFVAAPKYKPRLPFHAIVRGVANSRMNLLINEAAAVVIKKYWSNR